MLLRVNPRTGIWGFKSSIDPSYQIWFTVVDPRPHDISVEELPQDMKDAIAGALRTKTLIEVDERGEPLVRTTQQGVFSPVVSTARPLANPVMDKKAKELISGGVVSIRREVALVKNSLLLSTAIACERAGKNRKTVIDLLEKQLIKAADLSVSRNLGTMYSNLIEEEEGEVIRCTKQDLIVVEEELTQEEVEEVQERLEEEWEGG